MDISMTKFMAQRSAYSKTRLDVLKEKVSKIQYLRETSNLSIYVTGSYGRFEASKRSDIDLFFVCDDTSGGNKINLLTKILIDAELIKIVQLMKFPEFTNEGQYLEVHYLDPMLEALGGRDDDFKNYFTARLLLLLESYPIYNDKIYDRIIEKIVDAYFRDYHDHEKEFRPIFLVNDIIRFWRTLCLNYENKRNISSQDKCQKNKNHLRNLKLKFSRMLTCFSTVIPLCVLPKASPQDISGLVRRPPLERLQNIVQDKTDMLETFDKILEGYMWFLKITARKDIVEWIGERNNRNCAFGKARHFGENMFSLLKQSSRHDNMRYLVM